MLAGRLAAAQGAAAALLPAGGDAGERRELSTSMRIWTLIVVLLALALVQTSLTALYPAAPTMAREIGASQTDITWIVDVYTLAMAGLLLPAGALGDRFGRRGLMNIGLGLFALSSVAPLLFDSPGELMAARAVQGVAAALIMPSTLSLITSLFPARYRDGAIGVWTAVFALGGALGAIMAGTLLEFFAWRSVFWGLLVFAVIAFVCSLTIPSSTEENPPRLDVWGSVTGAVTILGAVYGLIEAGHAGWSNGRVLLAFGICLAAGAAFVVLQLRIREPLLDVRLFAIRPFGVSAFAVTILFAAAYGTFFLAMQYQQLILGFSPLKSGLAICAMGFGILPITSFCAWATRRFGLRWIISGGFVASTMTFVILLQTDVDSPYSLVVVSMIVFGVGAGLNMAPCTTAIIDNVSAEKQGVAAAVNHTTREVGTALGVALCGSVLTSAYIDGVRESTATLPEPAREASRESLAGALAVAEQSGDAGAPLALAAQEAFISGMHETFVVLIVLLAATAVITAFWGPGPARAAPVGAAIRPQPAETYRGGVPELIDGSDSRTVRGLVADRSGIAVSRASVLLTDLSGRQLGRAVTDERGRFTMPSQGVRGLLICIVDGFEPYIENADLSMAQAQHDIALTRAVGGRLERNVHAVAGTLRAAPHGDPVPGVTVRLMDSSGQVVDAVVSATDGSYRFEHVLSGAYRLQFDVSRRYRRMLDIPAESGGELVIDLGKTPEPASTSAHGAGR